MFQERLARLWGQARPQVALLLPHRPKTYRILCRDLMSEDSTLDSLGRASTVAVVIAAYRARNYLRKCLESIGHQTVAPKEVLVVDDCSPEPVDDIIADFASFPGYPPIRLIKHDRNRGQAAARNTGAAATDAEFLAFLDHDDVWGPRHLEDAMKVLTDSNADLSFCPAQVFQKEPGDLDFVERPMTPAEQALEPLALLARCFIITSSVAVGRNRFHALGGFNEDARMRAVEDLDFFMRLLKAGATIAMAPDVTLYYRKHSGSATGQPAGMAFQVGHVTAVHAHRFGGSWFRCQSLVARTWWRAWNTCLRHGQVRPDILTRAVLSSAFVPLEIARGVSRSLKVVTAGR